MQDLDNNLAKLFIRLGFKPPQDGVCYSFTKYLDGSPEDQDGSLYLEIFPGSWTKERDEEIVYLTLKIGSKILSRKHEKIYSEKRFMDLLEEVCDEGFKILDRLYARLADFKMTKL